ncbi:unnamed protein product [Effrenium voratum]|uniref:Uncharacterized protein n=1 Tax=Effrenium voratum TaxID=2562239 RepID=A0AA36HUX7_9DINO|nr:unnamed protein product [Effrenium voratum]CAJ1441446.1 unnamed protein product [Effrenium voratum]
MARRCRTLGACLLAAFGVLSCFVSFPAPQESRVAMKASIMAQETKQKQPKFKYESQLIGLSPEEIQARKQRALDIWESLKPDVEQEMERYQTFRPDKFEEFMKADSRGVALFELYKPGTPEYAELFEEVLGPFLLDLAKGKLSEGLYQAIGVIVVVGILAWLFAFFGTDIVQGVTSPFSGFAQQFTELYGF